MKITIIIPVYNEEKTLEKIIHKINQVKTLNKEIIIVDDCSTDSTKHILKTKIKKKVSKIIYHKKNTGKGGAIKTAKRFMSGDIILIQDADLEYYPSDYNKLVKPIIDRKYDVVYGSRVLGRIKNKKKSKYTSLIRIFGNYILTLFSNFINNQKLTDAHTCYKVFSKSVFNKIKLEENDFAFCPEITTKISNLKIKILEVPIKYNGREFIDGKKIRFIDAFFAIKAIIKYKFFK
jgi:dolichol-phosphate mannosyltransferase